MLPYMRLLHAFCVVDPTLCAPASDPSQFVITLQPYLKSQVVHLFGFKLSCGLFTFDATPVSDSTKTHYFWRFRHTPVDIFEESEKHCF